MPVRHRRGGATLAGLLLGLVAAGCSSSGSPNPTPAPTATGTATLGGSPNCSTVKCSGTINGAAFVMDLPPKWNGKLLLWNHGYTLEHPVPGTAPADTSPHDGPSDSGPSDGRGNAVRQALLNQGYALAGSAFSRQGWDIPQALPDTNSLYNYFVENVGKPQKTYVWGGSLGGLITELEAEAFPWVDGAAPMCGVLAGANQTMDLAMDGAWGIQQVAIPNLQIDDYQTDAQADTAFTTVKNYVVNAAKTLNKAEIAKVYFVASLVGAATKAEDADGSTAASTLQAMAESLLTGLGFGTVGREGFENQVGGQYSTNIIANYANRLTATEKQQVDALGGAGSAQKWVNQLQAAARVKYEQDPRVKANTVMGNPTGNLKVPTITMHTEYDNAVPVFEETVFKQRVTSNNKTAQLLQFYTKPPAKYTKAPYGAGHCNFSAAETLGIVQGLDQWVTTGVKPTPEQYKAAVDKLGANGIDLTYQPPPWPAVPVEPLSQPGQT